MVKVPFYIHGEKKSSCISHELKMYVIIRSMCHWRCCCYFSQLRVKKITFTKYKYLANDRHFEGLKKFFLLQNHAIVKKKSLLKNIYFSRIFQNCKVAKKKFMHNFICDNHVEFYVHVRVLSLTSKINFKLSSFT